MKVELKDRERIDDLQRNGYQIIQNPEKFCFGMDAVLLTGYTMTDITYVDPSTGESYTVGMSEMENMTEAGGNTFIGYIR